MKVRKRLRIVGLLCLACVLMVVGPMTIVAQASNGAADTGSNDSQIQADVTKALDGKRFKNVKVAVANGVVTLTGTVDVYADKEDADDRAHHRKNVKGVQNLIAVAGPTVDDVTLRDKLA